MADGGYRQGGPCTHVLLSGPAAGPGGIDLPPGRPAFHLAETNDGADQAAVVIDEITTGTPAGYVAEVAAGDCDALLKDTTDAVTAYDDLARTDKASS